MKKKVEYPSKQTINLCMKEPKNLHLGRTAALLAVLLALVCVFCKFAVLDRLDKANEVKSQIAALELQKTELQKAVSGFKEVKAEYRRFSVGWMTDEEKNLVRRSQVLELLETDLLPSCTVSSVNISQNTLSLQLADTTLSEVSKLVEVLYTRDIVKNVSVYNASSKNASDAVALSMVITLKQA